MPVPSAKTGFEGPPGAFIADPAVPAGKIVRPSIRTGNSLREDSRRKILPGPRAVSAPYRLPPSPGNQ